MNRRDRALRAWIKAPSDREATDVLIDAAKDGGFDEPEPRTDGPSRDSPMVLRLAVTTRKAAAVEGISKPPLRPFL